MKRKCSLSILIAVLALACRSEPRGGGRLFSSPNTRTTRPARPMPSRWKRASSRSTASTLPASSPAPGGGNSVRNAMATDLGFGDVTAAPVIAAAAQGQDIKIIGITSRSLADLVLIVMPNSPLKTANDLKGKKFGISNPKSLGEMMGVLVMEQAGLKQGDVQMTAARQPGRRAHGAGERRGRCHRHSGDPVPHARRREQIPRAGRPQGAAAHSVAARHGDHRRDQEEPGQAARHPGGAPRGHQVHLRAHRRSHPDPQQGL